MMWFRRVIAIMLAFIFILVFIPTLVIFRINDTVGNSAFYTAQLRKADIYNFVYDSVLPSAIEDAYSHLDNPEFNISVLKPYMAPLVEDTVPRAWLQIQVEESINVLLPYILGDTKGFQIQIPLKDRAKVGAQSIKKTLRQDSVFHNLYDLIINYIVNKDLFNLKVLSLSREQSLPLVKAALPEQWLLTQIDNAIDGASLYLASDQEHFTVHLDLKNRLTDLEPAVNNLLKETEYYNAFIDNILIPALDQNTQIIAQLSAKGYINDDDIRNAEKEVFSLEWYQSRIPDITGPIFAYLNGTQPTLEVELPLDDRKSVAVAALTQLVNNKAGKDISASTIPILNELVNQLIPDRLAIDDVLFSDDGVRTILTEARDSISKGETFTDENLGTIMGPGFENVGKLRQRITEGIVFTDNDLRVLLQKTNNYNYTANSELQTFDNIRHLLGTMRRWRMLAWLVPVLLLAAIGALGACKWPNKLIWGASVLAVTSALVYILFGPVYSVLAQPKISAGLLHIANQTQGFEGLITEKVVSIAQNSIDNFIGGIKLQVLILFFVSVLIIGFGIVWQQKKGKKIISS
jgi:hypothetical protein